MFGFLIYFFTQPYNHVSYPQCFLLKFWSKHEVKNLEYAFSCQVGGGFSYRSMKFVKKFELQACSSTTLPFFLSGY